MTARSTTSLLNENTRKAIEQQRKQSKPRQHQQQQQQQRQHQQRQHQQRQHQQRQHQQRQHQRQQHQQHYNGNQIARKMMDSPQLDGSPSGGGDVDGGGKAGNNMISPGDSNSDTSSISSGTPSTKSSSPSSPFHWMEVALISGEKLTVPNYSPETLQVEEMREMVADEVSLLRKRPVLPEFLILSGRRKKEEVEEQNNINKEDRKRSENNSCNSEEEEESEDDLEVLEDLSLICSEYCPTKFVVGIPPENLLERGERTVTNARARKVKTALRDAIKQNDVPRIQFMLACGETGEAQKLWAQRFGLNVVDERNETVLHTAARGGFLKSCQLLLEKAPTKMTETTNDAEVDYVRDNKQNKVRFLHASYPVVCTSRKKRHDTTKTTTTTIDTSGGGPPVEGCTALHIAAENGHVDVCEFFLQQSDNNNNNSDNNLIGGKFKFCHKAINFQSTVSGNTALHLAAEKNSEVCNVFLESGKFIGANVQNNEGYTALHMAAAVGRVDVCKTLLETDKFTAVNVANKEGWTALHLAASGNRPDVCKILLESDKFTAANMQNKDGWTALHVAACSSCADVCKTLLESDKFIAAKVQNGEGGTALHVAAACSRVDVCKILLQSGAFLSAYQHVRNVEGKTAFHIRSTIHPHKLADVTRAMIDFGDFDEFGNSRKGAASSGVFNKTKEKEAI